MPKFLRRTWSRYSKLGKRRKKKQVWRSPKGRDNKMREKQKAYPAVVSMGYGTNKKNKTRIRGKIPVLVKNLNDLKKMNEKQIAIIGKIGRKNKIEMVKKAKEMKIQIHNLNTEKFLKQNPRMKKEENKK